VPAAASEPTARHASRVLVVDDNVDAANTLAMLLDAAGHQVATEHTAHGALAAAGRGAFDVILLDIGLPDMSGHALAAALRQLPCCARAALIAVSGYGQEHDRRMSQQAGFAAHLVKPVAADELDAAIARVCATSQAQA
jgi:CheY-like chemotaxis protein